MQTTDAQTVSHNASSAGLESRGARPPRVGFVVDGDEGGGVAVMMQRILEALDPQRAEVVGLFLGAGRTRTALAPLCAEVCDLSSGRLLPISNPERPKYDLGNLMHKARVFRRATRAALRAIRDRRIDVLHVHQYPLHLVAGWAARAAGIPCLWHWHGAKTRGRVPQALLSVAMRYLAAHVICISEFVRASLPPGGQSRSSVVYNGVWTDAIRDAQQPGALRERLDLSQDHPIVAIVGSLTEYKGHRYFIRAAARVRARFPRARFVVIGGETAVQRSRFGLEQQWRQLANDCGVANEVLFCGALPDAVRYFCDCDIVCLPTAPIGIRGEGFGLTIVEAMAAGVAVVATDCGGPREIIEPRHSGLLVPPQDDVALAGAIMELLQHPDRRAALVSAGRKRAKCFDITRTARALEDLYARCAAPRHARGNTIAAHALDGCNPPDTR